MRATVQISKRLCFVCPKCGERFQFFIPSARRIRTSLFSSSWRECPRCQALSCVVVSWLNAIWAWPLALFGVLGVIAFYQNAPFLCYLHHSSPGLYGVLGGLSMAPFFFIVRFGLKLDPLCGESGSHSQPIFRLGFVLFLGLCIAGFAGLITHRWIPVLASMAVCLAVSTVFYMCYRPKYDRTRRPN